MTVGPFIYGVLAPERVNYLAPNDRLENSTLWIVWMLIRFPFNWKEVWPFKNTDRKTKVSQNECMDTSTRAKTGHLNLQLDTTVRIHLIRTRFIR